MRRSHCSGRSHAQPATSPHDLQPAREGRCALSAPRGDEGVDGAEMRVTELRDPGGVQPRPQHPAPDRGRVGREGGRVEGAVVVDQLVTAPVGQGGERGVVVGELGGGAGERGRHPAGQHVLEQGKDLVAQPDAGVARVGVVGVVPHREAGGGARRAGGRAPHAQQRAAPRRVPGGHARERARARPAPESQEHGLGLVVERVTEQHGRVPVLL